MSKYSFYHQEVTGRDCPRLSYSRVIYIIASGGCWWSLTLLLWLNEAFQDASVSPGESKGGGKAAWELREAQTLLLWDPPNATHDKRPARHLATPESNLIHPAQLSECADRFISVYSVWEMRAYCERAHNMYRLCTCVWLQMSAQDVSWCQMQRWKIRFCIQK